MPKDEDFFDMLLGDIEEAERMIDQSLRIKPIIVSAPTPFKVYVSQPILKEKVKVTIEEVGNSL